jgi:hypothetical protein
VRRCASPTAGRLQSRVGTQSRCAAVYAGKGPIGRRGDGEGFGFASIEGLAVQERLGVRRTGPARGEGADRGRGKRKRDEARGLPRPHLIGPAEGAFVSLNRLVVLTGCNERVILHAFSPNIIF